jgi:hypothetical protein
MLGRQETVFEQDVQELIADMIASGRYRALLWAGGYPQHGLHAHSDTDLYSVSNEELPFHWSMERVGGRRVELTAYPLERWQALLSQPYSHPKHHYTFAHAQVLFDPESLCPDLRRTAENVLASWPPASAETLAEMRNGVAIQHDKIAGFREKNMPLHLRLLAEGFAILACLLLVTAWDGYGVDAGKNLTRVLGHPECPPDIRATLTTLLSSGDTEEMADAALSLCDRCLELTGGPIDSYQGGIPR